jgi:hypothetical protein
MEGKALRADNGGVIAECEGKFFVVAGEDIS